MNQTSSTFQVGSIRGGSGRIGSGRPLPPIPTALPPRQTALPPRQTALPPRSVALPPRSPALPPRQAALPPRSPQHYSSQSPGASDSLNLSSDGRPFADKYCSCVFKVTGSNYKKNYPASPYAICSSSIYNRRGLKGPGSSIRCTYPKEYLDRLSYDELFNFAAAKGIVTEDEYGLDANTVKQFILEWGRLEKEIQSKVRPNRGWKTY